MTNAEQLKSALLSHGGIEGVRVAVMQSVEEEAVVDDNRKIIGINKLNNFEFKDEILVAWRAYGMGKGKEIPLEKHQKVGLMKIHNFIFFRIISSRQYIFFKV